MASLLVDQVKSCISQIFVQNNIASPPQEHMLLRKRGAGESFPCRGSVLPIALLSDSDRAAPHGLSRT